MSVIGSNILAGASGQGGDYTIARSLRFRSSASAFLNRTPASAGNQQKWTYSLWLKRGTLSTVQNLLVVGTNIGGQQSTQFGLNSNNTIQFFDGLAGISTSIIFDTTQVFRDPSAWYHIILAVDTTQATSTNRVKMYVNGVEITAFTSSTYPTQNFNTLVNAASAHFIGRFSNVATNYFDGYLAETYLIDGQQLTPSSFGANSTTTGVWQPKKYAGTYGTNGFYLPFTNNSTTTTLGNDFSGNGNNWTTNNISLTAGSTYDSMTDVPTLTSATASNFAVLNPLNKIYSSATISDGNLNFTTSTTNMGAFGSFQLPTSGKYYWEIVMTANAGANPLLGFGPATDSLGNAGVYYRTDGTKNQYGGVSGNGTSSYGATWTTNDVIGIAYDADTSGGQVTFYKNNSSQGVAYSSLNTNFPNGLFASFQSNASGTTSFQANFGQRGFLYTPPSGFVALNTFNLPTPTIGATASTQANKYFDATTYTGNASSRSIVNAGQFQPDLVWIKDRSQAYNNNLYDSVRGIYKELLSNATAAETNQTRTLIGFNNNGFALGDDGDGRGVNINGDAFVAWQWRANGTPAVTNTAGSITSTVSANTTAGFSVVTYTGTGANATVGHGLGVAPRMIIIKRRDGGANNWRVYHRNMAASPATGTLYLSLTNGFTVDSSEYNNTPPTSSVFSLGNQNSVNGSGGTFVAYCFAPVTGYSAFGSYTGNGSADGTFVFTGFRPRYVMTKRTDSTSNWTIQDAARSPSNVVDAALFANLSVADNTGPWFDLVSNGFKVRSNGSDTNASGGTYIYMAFAEVPTKFALAR
jgi:hypothetical protein